METALRTRLVNAAGVSALVGTRVYWAVRPQDSALPAVVLTLVSDDRSQNMDGFDGFNATRVQVDCYAATYGAAADLREAVIAAIVPANTTGGTEFLRAQNVTVMQRGEDAPTAYVHRQMIDLTIWHD